MANFKAHAGGGAAVDDPLEKLKLFEGVFPVVLPRFVRNGKMRVYPLVN